MNNQEEFVVVTGSNKGIGKSIVQSLAKNGSNIWACTRKKNTEFTNFLNEIKASNPNISILESNFDLSSIDAVKKAALEIINSGKKIVGLVNNAGIIHNASFQMTSTKVFKDVFDVNFFSPALLTQYIIKNMLINKSGSIVNISSTAAFDSVKGRSAYSSSKAAMESLSKVISSELGKFNIRINCVAPGATDTDMLKKNHTNENLKIISENLSLARMGKPKEIADLVLFLLSEKSSYITGQTIRVDGGM